MQKQIRLLFLIDELDIGGTEQQIFELATRINRERYLPVVCCFRKGQIAREIEDSGVPVFSLKKRGKADLPFLLHLARLLKVQRIDLLQTYLFTANIWGHLAAKLARVPIVVSSERNVDIWEKLYKRMSGRLLARSSDAVIVNAEAIKRYLMQRGARPEKIITIYNGVNSERFNSSLNGQETRNGLGIDREVPVIANVARLEPQKGHFFLLQSARLILEKSPQVKFLIVGEGPERNKLESLSRTLGIARSVIFTGATRNVPKLLNACDVSVLASSKEGMSNSLLESMILGKPVVATNVGGNDELIVDGITGFLVPRDDPSALAKASLKLIENRELSRRLGEKAKEKALRQFSVPQMVRSTEDLYERLISSKLGSLSLTPTLSQWAREKDQG